MSARRFSAASVMIAAAAISGAVALGVPSAGATSDLDQRFLEIVQQLDVKTNSPEEAVQIGRQICNTLEAGQVEPARTVRAVLSQLMAQGLEKGKAANLMRGAVSVYCPRYGSFVGR